jgi:hypothetical protein
MKNYEKTRSVAKKRTCGTFSCTCNGFALPYGADTQYRLDAMPYARADTFVRIYMRRCQRICSRRNGTLAQILDIFNATLVSYGTLYGL